MYRLSQGHEHLGPGTSLVQRINWTPAQENEMRGFAGFSFPGAEFASDCMAVSGTCAEGAMRGLGCGCGKSCGQGLGLFESGADFSQWGVSEWAIIGLGAYLVLSIAGDTRRASTSIRRTVRRRRSRREAVAA